MLEFELENFEGFNVFFGAFAFFSHPFYLFIYVKVVIFSFTVIPTQFLIYFVSWSLLLTHFPFLCSQILFDFIFFGKIYLNSIVLMLEISFVLHSKVPHFYLC